MISKSSVINYLLYSTKNSVTVEEELAQFDDLFKQLIKVHNKYLSTEVNGNEKEKQNQWFEEVDEHVLASVEGCSIRRRKGIKTFFKAKFEKFWTFQEK